MDQIKTAYDIFKITYRFKNLYFKALKEADIEISPLYVRPLYHIECTPNCTATDIGDKMERDKAQITRMINHLIKQGLIKKVENPKDKRSHYLKLTEKGEGVFLKMREVEKKLIQKMFEPISSIDHHHLENILPELLGKLGHMRD